MSESFNKKLLEDWRSSIERPGVETENWVTHSGGGGGGGLVDRSGHLLKEMEIFEIFCYSNFKT